MMARENDVDQFNSDVHALGPYEHADQACFSARLTNDRFTAAILSLSAGVVQDDSWALPPRSTTGSAAGNVAVSSLEHRLARARFWNVTNRHPVSSWIGLSLPPASGNDIWLNLTRTGRGSSPVSFPAGKMAMIAFKRQS